MKNLVISTWVACEIYVKSLITYGLSGCLNFLCVHHFFNVKQRISEMLAGLIWAICCEMALAWIKNERKVKGPYFSIHKRFFFILIKIQFKVNESRYIALFAFSYNLSKSFSQLIVSTLPVGKRLGLPYIAYIVIH